jgi:hypothetical protein
METMTLDDWKNKGSSVDSPQTPPGDLFATSRTMPPSPAFASIDLDEEDRLVMEYKRTGDERIFASLYEARKPTLLVWARRYKYLTKNDEQDAFSLFSQVFVKCIQRYECVEKSRPARTKKGAIVHAADGTVKMVMRKTHFNTFFFTAFRNYAANVYKKLTTKKRVDDWGVPFETTMRSLDSELLGRDGCLLDLIPDMPPQHCEEDLDWVIDQVSDGDTEVAEALRCFAKNRQIRKISTACRIRTGVLPAPRYNSSDWKYLIVGGEPARRLVERMIRESGRYRCHFVVSSYSITTGGIVEYEAYLKETRLGDRVRSLLRRFRAQASSSRGVCMEQLDVPSAVPQSA